MSKPIIPWMGGKRRLAKDILPLIPAHTCYVEPFVGGAAIYFMKEPSKVEVLNDINGELVNLYRVLKHHLEEFLKQFKWALHSRQMFEWEKLTDPRILTDIQGKTIGGSFPDELKASGLDWFKNYGSDGTYELPDDTPQQDIDAVKALFAAHVYDQLKVDKDRKIEDLKHEALQRMNSVYSDTAFATVGMVELLIDIEATYDRSGVIAPRLASVNAVLTAFKAARTPINALTTKAKVAAYDVATDPAWP